MGNHTDHNNGKVVAAAINLDIIAVAAKSESNIIRIKSKGHSEDILDVSEEVLPDPTYFHKSRALIAGVHAGFLKDGYLSGGFDAYTTTDVLKGSGLSSSAAFEVMVGNIINHLYNGGEISDPKIAKIARFAENEYFGKPCGLMDQMACSVGGFVYMDFADNENPTIKNIHFDLDCMDYCLCIVNTGGNHADLNEDYAAVPNEMKKVAEFFGKTVLREIDKQQVLSAIPQLREAVGDRAIMRALHYFDENVRVHDGAQALISSDIFAFTKQIKASGDSSFKFLQNVYTTSNVAEQGLSLALCITQDFLKNREGACRVHGGGFAGTIQTFIKEDDVAEYKDVVESTFGKGACSVLYVRRFGAIKL